MFIQMSACVIMPVYVLVNSHSCSQTQMYLEMNAYVYA